MRRWVGLLAHVIAVLIAVSGCASKLPKAAPTLRPGHPAYWDQPVAIIHRTLAARLQQVIVNQQFQWKFDETAAHGTLGAAPVGTNLVLFRVAMLHCHADGLFTHRGEVMRGMGPQAPYPTPTMIRSAYQFAAVCPNWPPLTVTEGGLFGHTAARKPDAVPKLFPDDLIALLDSASQLHADEPWFLRQTLRAVIENGDLAHATRLIARCTGRQWCGLLEGYVYYLERDWARATAAWATELSAMAPLQRCVLLTTEALEPTEGEDTKMAIRDSALVANCSARVEIDRNVWWLAKPLFGDDANYRLLEHIARQIRSSLAHDLDQDAHFDLRLAAGGDAVRAMRLRYGWPAHLYWPGVLSDQSHEAFMQSRSGSKYAIPPYASPEYSRDVISTLPARRAALAPLTVADSDFVLDAERNHDKDRAWPREFFEHPNGVIYNIRTHQRALLRRDTSSLLVIATELPTPTAPAVADSAIRLRVIASPNTEVIGLLNEVSARWGSRAFIAANLATPAVIGLEVQGGGARIAGARSRFGIASLSSHATATTPCAVSEPILLDANTLQGAGMDDLQRGMLSDVRLQRPQKLGLLWETYGLRVGDTVTISVRVIGESDRTGVGRVAQALGIVGRQEAAISVSWTEPSSSRYAATVASRVPTVLRELALDVGELREGRYGVQVIMTATKCSASSPIRAFTVTR